MSQTAEPEQSPSYSHYAIIPHATEPQVLLLPGEGGWHLPQWARNDEKRHDEYWAAVGRAQQTIAEQLGVRVTTRRCVRSDGLAGSDPRKSAFTYWMENHSLDWTPPGARWLKRAELSGLALAVPEQRGLLEAWFADAEDGPTTALRSPWAQPGWFDAAAAWVEARMNEQGIAPTGPVEQHKSLTISCLLRVETTSGRLYMKASPPEMFATEAALTQMLAERYPHSVPWLLAADAARSWMLMRDVGGVPLWKVPQIARWEEVVRVYAWMQVEFVERTESLVALGCRDRRLDRVAAGIEPLLAHVAAEPEHPQRLSAGELERLHALVPRLRTMCAELGEYRVPATLEHGDLHAGNVAVTGEACTLYDWSDGCLSHPFFSMVTLLDHTDGITDCPDPGARLRNLYLEAWTKFEPMDRLRRAYDLSQVLGRLHQAQSYHWISTHLEESARWEWEWASSEWLKGVLKCVDEPR